MTNTAKTELVCNTMMSKEDNMPTQRKHAEFYRTAKDTQQRLCGRRRASFRLFDCNYMPAQKAVRHFFFSAEKLNDHNDFVVKITLIQIFLDFFYSLNKCMYP